jgi:hypothetical protein
VPFAPNNINDTFLRNHVCVLLLAHQRAQTDCRVHRPEPIPLSESLVLYLRMRVYKLAHNGAAFATQRAAQLMEIIITCCHEGVANMIAWAIKSGRGDYGSFYDLNYTGEPDFPILTKFCFKKARNLTKVILLIWTSGEVVDEPNRGVFKCIESPHYAIVVSQMDSLSGTEILIGLLAAVLLQQKKT